MKAITEEWLSFAFTDLQTCECILDREYLTNVVAYHFEKGQQLPKIHSLTKLYNIVENSLSFNVNDDLLRKFDTLYTASRYPSEMGLMPDGKPSSKIATELFECAKFEYESTLKQLS